MDDATGTWHYGLIARWWSEFNSAEPRELDYLRAMVGRFGEPVLDLGCGTGRLLAPLAAEGLEVDGVDVSADMIAAARAHAPRARLMVQALHELDLDRAYGTAYMCGVFGIGGRRDHDRQALRRVHQLLNPGGALLIMHQLPYDDGDSWSEWLPGLRKPYPDVWPENGNRKRSADGDELELLTRVEAFDPLQQQLVLGMRARLWRGGAIVREETYLLRSCVYFAQEIVAMLGDAGFGEVTIEGDYTGQAATAADANVIFVAIKR